MEVIDENKGIARRTVQVKFLQYRLEEIGKRDIGVEDTNGPQLPWIDPFQKRTHQGRFTQTNFASNGHKTLTGINTVNHRAQCCFMTRTEKKEMRVGGNVEGHLFKTVKVKIHDCTLVRIWAYGHYQDAVSAQRNPTVADRSPGLL